MATINQWAVPRRSTLQRGLALAQQVKDSVNILLFLGNGYLIMGVIFGGIAIPGLVLYALRWKQLRAQGRRAPSAGLWLLSLGHELLCAGMFADDHPHVKQGENDDPLGHFEPLYLLGAAICAVGLLHQLWECAHPDAE
jgi:hypothetical protein